MKASKEILSKK